METSKLRPSGSTIRYSPTMSPLGVVSGQPEVYRNDFARLDRRLLADDAGSAHFLMPAGRVGDPPVALHQRHGFVAEIDDLDRIAPEIAAFVRIGAFRIEGRLDGDFDLMRHGFVHAIVILAAPIAPSTVSVVVFGATPARFCRSGRMTGEGRLAEAKALLARLIAFDSVSDSSNLPLDRLCRGLPARARARIAPRAECGRRQGRDPRHDRASRRWRRGALGPYRRRAGGGAAVVEPAVHVARGVRAPLRPRRLRHEGLRRLRAGDGAGVPGRRPQAPGSHRA